MSKLANVHHGISFVDLFTCLISLYWENLFLSLKISIQWPNYCPSELSLEFKVTQLQIQIIIVTISWCVGYLFISSCDKIVDICNHFYMHWIIAHYSQICLTCYMYLCANNYMRSTYGNNISCQYTNTLAWHAYFHRHSSAPDSSSVTLSSVYKYHMRVLWSCSIGRTRSYSYNGPTVMNEYIGYGIAMSSNCSEFVGDVLQSIA